MSHDEQADLRVRRTHKFLHDALIALITEKGFDAITVGDIAERAMINRATFYRHYQDKYELVTRIYEETTTRLVENMAPIRKDGDKRATVNPPEIWILFFAHVAEYAPLYRAMLGKNGSPWFAARMREHTIKIMLEQESEWQNQGARRQSIDRAIPQELAATQLAHALIGTIVWWLENENRATPRQVATWFHRFAFFGYLAARGYAASIPGKD